MNGIIQTYPEHPDFTSWPISVNEVCDAFKDIQVKPIFFRLHWTSLCLDTLAVEMKKKSTDNVINNLLNCIANSTDGLDEISLQQESKLNLLCLRAQFSLGLFSQQHVQKLHRHYKSINKSPSKENYDVLLCYQLVLGYTNQLRELLLKSEVLLNNNILDKQNILQARIVSCLIDKNTSDIPSLIYEYENIYQQNVMNRNRLVMRGDWVDFFVMAIHKIELLFENNSN